MIGKLRLGTAAGILTVCVASLLPATPVTAQSLGVTAGILNCNVSSGWGFILGSSRDLSCVYSPTDGVPQRYVGKINKFGVDIGYLSGATMVWAVAAPTSGPPPGSLTGDYLGATGSASVGVGVGANVLFGGFDRSITLQPISIEGNQGLDVAAGIGAVSLMYQQ
jgi:Protein of unknown function (DUF992)